MHVFRHEPTIRMTPKGEALHRSRRRLPAARHTSERARRRILQRRTGEMRVLPARLLHLTQLMLSGLEFLQLGDDIRRRCRDRFGSVGVEFYGGASWSACCGDRDGR